MELKAFQDMIELQETHWWYCARRTILARLLEKFVPVGGRVLEVGAGTGSNLELLQKWGTVTALEPNRFAADYLARNFSVKVLRAAVPASRELDRERFDLIAALDVLEHIEEETAALDFMVRRLRPGGWLLITVPAFAFLWSTHDEALHHKRRYRMPELARKLRYAGLAVIFQSYFNSLLFPLALATRLVDRLRPGTARSGAKRVPATANRILRFAFELEAPLLQRFRLPFGLSIVLFARKPKQIPRPRAAGQPSVPMASPC
ncbi:MAG: class I SAM-dependent methyltransferase [Gemmatimonadetes bacterium]|nr:class I SAM-dependent methyltransferase [Gemmatimonadota bacterium]